MEKLVKPMIPFLAAILVVLFLVAFVPETVLFIPRMMGFVK
jgi:TRAP-type C4-dicarboxylate transport system permease large subunit